MIRIVLRCKCTCVMAVMNKCDVHRQRHTVAAPTSEFLLRIASVQRGVRFLRVAGRVRHDEARWFTDMRLVR